MDPSFKQIADLFGMSLPAHQDVEVATGPRKTKGENAAESAELAGLSLSEGDYAKAIEHFRRAVEQSEGKDPMRVLDLGGAFEFADMEPQALRQYRTALKAKADAPEPHLGIAELYRRDGRRRNAIAEIEAALQANPKNAYFQFKLAELYAELGEKSNALVAIQHAVAADPADAFYHYWMGDLLIRMKRHGEALDAFRAAIELSPGDDHLYVRAAIAFWNSGKHAEAVKSIRLAGDLDPDKLVYHGMLELLLSEMGLDEEADLEAKSAEKMDRYDQDLLARFAAEIGLVA